MKRISIHLLVLAFGVISITCHVSHVAARMTIAQAQIPPPSAVQHTPLGQQPNYEALRRKIASGMATLAECRKALTETDVGGLTNTVHALYSMGWHRGVYHVLHDMWNKDRAKYPEFAWDLIVKAPVRIALASTINRLELSGSNVYLDYIRAHKYDKHEFHRAQVVVALGLNGNPEDIKYIKSMADGDDHYVVQSAITALALMNSKKASDALIELWKKYRDTPRGTLIEEVLQRAYNLVPHKRIADARDEHKK